MRDLLTFVVVTVPRWIRDWRWRARQDFVSRGWLEERKRAAIPLD